MSAWESVARFCSRVYGLNVIWSERYYVCPGCEDVIFEKEYNNWDDFHSEDETQPFCPICGYRYGS